MKTREKGKGTGKGKKSALFRFTAAAALAGFFAPFFLLPSRRAEAGDPDEIAELIAEITTLETTLMLTEYLTLNAVKSEMKEEINRVTSQAAYYNFMVARDKRLEQEYQDNHAMLKDIVWTDRTLEIQNIYSQLSQADAQSFADSVDVVKFQSLNPGYRTPQGDDSIHFSQLYKDRMTEWMSYSKGVLAANKTEAQSVLLFQLPGVGISGLKDASTNAAGYLQLMQAGNQTYNMGAQLAERLRIDINRQTEARTRFALDERQEKTDERSAFDQAVTKWKNQTQGQNY